MQTENYKQILKDAILNLIKINQSIYHSSVPIMMAGEMKEWNDTVPIGETHNFDYEIFKNSNDTNIQLLIKLIENVDATFHSLKNINNIEIEED